MTNDNQLQADIQEIDNATIERVCETLRSYNKKTSAYLANIVAAICDVDSQEMLIDTKHLYNTHDDIVFDSSVDIIDISNLLKDIAHLDIDCSRKVCELCEKEIVPLDTPKVTETDLAIVVKALATNVKDWSKDRRPIEFDVDKKIEFNHLEGKKRLINDYKLYIGKLNAVYGEFVDNATDYSFIILQNLSDMYSSYLGQYESNAIFDKIVDEARELALNSKSAEDIPVDRVNVCINVIVVDAFIRCRIFEDPEGYSYVDA